MATTKATLAAENAALRKQVADLKLDIEIARQREAMSQRIIAAMTKPALRPQWQIGRAEAMAEAKEIAMHTGRSVKV
jgi:hypothetical protein